MSRRWVNVTIYESMLHYAFNGGRDRAITSDWPTDAQIVGGHWSGDTAQLVLTIESASFDEVLAGNVIPSWNPTFTAHAVEPGALAVMELIDRMKEDARARS